MSVLVEKMQNRIFFLRWFLYSISQVHNDLKILYFFRQAVGIIGASMWVQLGALRAAKDFHRSLLARMMRAPMSFFDTTPTGRILNRDRFAYA